MSCRVVISPNRSGSVWFSHPLPKSRITPATVSSCSALIRPPGIRVRSMKRLRWLSSYTPISRIRPTASGPSRSSISSQGSTGSRSAVWVSTVARTSRGPCFGLNTCWLMRSCLPGRVRVLRLALPVRLRPQELDRAVDPALLVRVLFPPPPAGALGLAEEDGPGARRAADRGEAVIEELVVRDLVRAHVVPDLVERPVGERVELDDVPMLSVELDLRDVAPAHPLLATKPRDPRVERRELALQRFDLGDVAARDPEVDRAVQDRKSTRLN